MPALLTLNGVCKAFVDGAHVRSVLKGLTLTVEPGQVVAVSGPSGSGKSTLLNVIAGIEPVDGGAVQLAVAGQQFQIDRMNEVQRARMRRQHIGFVFQFFNLIPTLTVFENILLPLQLAGRDLTDSEVLGRLRDVGLDDRRDAFPEQLSGGEQQRTAVARALCVQPALLLADEPTGNLDRGNGDEVLRLFFRLRDEAGTAMIIVTHDRHVASNADRQLRLLDGALTDANDAG